MVTATDHARVRSGPAGTQISSEGPTSSGVPSTALLAFVLGLGLVDGVHVVGRLGIGQRVAGPLDLTGLEDVDDELGAQDRVLVDELPERDIGDRRGGGDLDERQRVAVGSSSRSASSSIQAWAASTAACSSAFRSGAEADSPAVGFPAVIRTCRQNRQAEGHQDQSRRP